MDPRLIMQALGGAAPGLPQFNWGLPWQTNTPNVNLPQQPPTPPAPPGTPAPVQPVQQAPLMPLDIQQILAGLKGQGGGNQNPFSNGSGRSDATSQNAGGSGLQLGNPTGVTVHGDDFSLDTNEAGWGAIQAGLGTLASLAGGPGLGTIAGNALNMLSKEDPMSTEPVSIEGVGTLATNLGPAGMIAGPFAGIANAMGKLNAANLADIATHAAAGEAGYAIGNIGPDTFGMSPGPFGGTTFSGMLPDAYRFGPNRLKNRLALKEAIQKAQEQAKKDKAIKDAQARAREVAAERAANPGSRAGQGPSGGPGPGKGPKGKGPDRGPNRGL